MAAAAASSSSYDVFLNFRGEDTRFGFTSHLCKALRESRIRVFMDEPGIGRGTEISVSLLQAIERSRIAIIIFSPHYASSTWCLHELVKIMECRRNQAQVVIPIFYKVDPSHVHDQTGEFCQVMEQCEQSLGRESDRVLRWRQALTAAAKISSDLHSADRYESDLVEKVVGDVLRELQAQELAVERINYDVFLSYGNHEEDIRRGFVSHLYKALIRRIGIHDFMDESRYTEERISASIVQAIERSRIALIIFSSDYASSRRCLNELVKIMECKRTQGLVVIPIFHGVDASEVRHQRGRYGEAMRQHENRGGIGIDQVEGWREAMTAAANLAGFSTLAYRSESEMVEEIVKGVSKILEI